MFCPSCGTQNETSQHYCRTCGLKLDGIATELALQDPSEEVAALLKKKKWLEFIGKSTLAISGIIGICLLLTLAVYYKLMLLGPEVLFGSAIGSLILFLLASIFFLAYPKFFLRIERLVPHSPEQSELTTPTSKLLNNPPFEPASVTEQSTELLTPRIDLER